ncbi:MAG: ISL3 family transposase [Chloroflexota bacterium]
MTATAPSSKCPRCNATSRSIHSHYLRRPRDLPWAGCGVHLRLAVRKFFCSNPACTRRIFTERLVGFLTSYARCTTRLTQILSVITFELGGRAGSRLAQRLAMTMSATGLLRLIRRTPDKLRPIPRVLGIDDFALLKGRTYGTNLVDLEHHRPVDLLPDRRAETVARWLQQHPGLEIITRDRSTEYSRGIALGAPKALQVADRFHIVANLREALERQLERVRSAFVGIELPRSQRRSALSLDSNFAPILRQPEIRSASERTVSAIRRKGKRTIVGQVRALYAEGYSVRSITQQLELSRTTVYRYLRSDSPLITPQRKIMPSILDEYVPYLSVRRQEGCENGGAALARDKATWVPRIVPHGDNMGSPTATDARQIYPWPISHS